MFLRKSAPSPGSDVPPPPPPLQKSQPTCFLFFFSPSSDAEVARFGPYLPAAPHLAVFGRSLSVASTDLRHLLPVTDINLPLRSSPMLTYCAAVRGGANKAETSAALCGAVWGKSMGNLSFHRGEKCFGWGLADEQQNRGCIVVFPHRPIHPDIYAAASRSC